MGRRKRRKRVRDWKGIVAMALLAAGGAAILAAFSGIWWQWLLDSFG